MAGAEHIWTVANYIKKIGREARREGGGHIDFSPFSSVFPMSSQSFIIGYMIFSKEKWVWVENNQKLSLSYFLGDQSSYFMGRGRKRGERMVSLQNILFMKTTATKFFWSPTCLIHSEQIIHNSLKSELWGITQQAPPLVDAIPFLTHTGNISVIDWLCLSLAHAVDEWEK